MQVDISCIINAHREGHILHPTIASVKRTLQYAVHCGLNCDIHVVLDKSDAVTLEIVQRELEGVGTLHEVSFGDLALSRNFAVENAPGEYLAFIDGDDLWGKSWLVDSYAYAKRLNGEFIFHPEFNIFFGDENSHVFNHVDMDAEDFEFESLLQVNYWTALSFSSKRIYAENPYQKNIILDGFGYEDWTWNYQTIRAGIRHKVVPGTAHYIRKGRTEDSLLALTNKSKAIPRILDIYRTDAVPLLRAVA